MKIHHLSVAEAFASVQSGPDGLMVVEAERRLAEFGPNQVEQLRHESLIRLFLKGFTHFFAIILWLAAGLAFVAEWRAPGQGMATLGFAVIALSWSTRILFESQMEAAQARVCPAPIRC